MVRWHAKAGTIRFGIDIGWSKNCKSCALAVRAVSQTLCPDPGGGIPPTARPSRFTWACSAWMICSPSFQSC